MKLEFMNYFHLVRWFFEIEIFPSWRCISIWLKHLEKKLDGNYTRILDTVLNILPNSNCMAIYLPSCKPSKKDKQNLPGINSEVRMNS